MNYARMLNNIIIILFSRPNKNPLGSAVSVLYTIFAFCKASGGMGDWDVSRSHDEWRQVFHVIFINLLHDYYFQ